MKKFLITSSTAIALAIPTIAPAAARASHINECGSTRWAVNITSRNVWCRDTRGFVIRNTSYAHVSLHGFRCDWHNYPDSRCTRGAQVIRWQYRPIP